MKTVIVGQGYVGLPLAVSLAELGEYTVGLEIDPVRVERLWRANSYVEDISDDQLRSAVVSGHYIPTLDENLLADFDVAVITVPTPLEKGHPDLSAVSAAAHTVGRYLKPGALVILESTTYPGTTREVVLPILETVSSLKAGRSFHLAYSPERIDPGNPEFDLSNTPKIVGGLSESCLDRALAFYERFIDDTLPATSLEAAEMAKVTENAFRLINIAFVNELARNAHKLGVDIRHVLDLCDTKPFGFTRFDPGPGVGGHCIPVDPIFLSERVRELGEMSQMIELARRINEEQPDYVVRRLHQGLNKRRIPIYGAHVLVLGASYKADTGDCRESPALALVKLLEENGAQVTTVDPYFTQDQLGMGRRLTEIPDAADLQRYDAILVATAHSDFRDDLGHVVASGVYTLDTRGLFPPGLGTEVEAL